MSMFEKLKGLFVIEDENANAKAAEKAVNDQKNEDSIASDVDSGTSTHNDYSVASEIPTEGAPDPKFMEILLKAVEKNNLEGFDYLEYKSSLQSLSKMDMDEVTKFKSALAMASTMGVTKDKLLSSANHYLGVLKDEKDKFTEATKNQKDKLITGQESSIDNMAKAIEAKKAKIEALKKEVEADTLKMEEMKNQIHKSAAKVQRTSDNFHYAYNIVTGQIVEDIEKMKNYLS